MSSSEELDVKYSLIDLEEILINEYNYDSDVSIIANEIIDKDELMEKTVDQDQKQSINQRTEQEDTDSINNTTWYDLYYIKEIV